MGQENSKGSGQQQPGKAEPAAQRHVDPGSSSSGPADAADDTAAGRASHGSSNGGGGGGGDGTATPPATDQQLSHDAAVDAEMQRMLRISSAQGGDGAVPGYVSRAQELAARVRALPPPKPPLVSSSTEAFMINRHERTVDEINRKTPVLHGSVPNPADAQRALAALQTSDLVASQAAAAQAQKTAEVAKRLAYEMQMLKASSARAAHDTRKASLALVGDCDALSLAVYGVSCRLAAGSHARATAASRVSPQAPTSPPGLVQLVAEVTAMARDIDTMLSEEDRAAVREAVAVMPVTPSPSSTAARRTPKTSPPPDDGGGVAAAAPS